VKQQPKAAVAVVPDDPPSDEVSARVVAPVLGTTPERYPYPFSLEQLLTFASVVEK
jgi:hypothetical protein